MGGPGWVEGVVLGVRGMLTVGGPVWGGGLWMGCSPWVVLGEVRVQ